MRPAGRECGAGPADSRRESFVVLHGAASRQVIGGESEDFCSMRVFLLVTQSAIAQGAVRAINNLPLLCRTAIAAGEKPDISKRRCCHDTRKSCVRINWSIVQTATGARAISSSSRSVASMASTSSFDLSLIMRCPLLAAASIASHTSPARSAPMLALREFNECAADAVACIAPGDRGCARVRGHGLSGLARLRAGGGMVDEAARSGHKLTVRCGTEQPRPVRAQPKVPITPCLLRPIQSAAWAGTGKPEGR